MAFGNFDSILQSLSQFRFASCGCFSMDMGKFGNNNNLFLLDTLIKLINPGGKQAFGKMNAMVDYIFGSKNTHIDSEQYTHTSSNIQNFGHTEQFSAGLPKSSDNGSKFVNSFVPLTEKQETSQQQQQRQTQEGSRRVVRSNSPIIYKGKTFVESDYHGSSFEDDAVFSSEQIGYSTEHASHKRSPLRSVSADREWPEYTDYTVKIGDSEAGSFNSYGSLSPVSSRVSSRSCSVGEPPWERHRTRANRSGSSTISYNRSGRAGNKSRSRSPPLREHHYSDRLRSPRRKSRSPPFERRHSGKTTRMKITRSRSPPQWNPNSGRSRSRPFETHHSISTLESNRSRSPPRRDQRSRSPGFTRTSSRPSPPRGRLSPPRGRPSPPRAGPSRLSPPWSRRRSETGNTKRSRSPVLRSRHSVDVESRSRSPPQNRESTRSNSPWFMMEKSPPRSHPGHHRGSERFASHNVKEQNVSGGCSREPSWSTSGKNYVPRHSKPTSRNYRDTRREHSMERELGEIRDSDSSSGYENGLCAIDNWFSDFDLSEFSSEFEESPVLKKKHLEKSITSDKDRSKEDRKASKSTDGKGVKRSKAKEYKQKLNNQTVRPKQEATGSKESKKDQSRHEPLSGNTSNKPTKEQNAKVQGAVKNSSERKRGLIRKPENSQGDTRAKEPAIKVAEKRRNVDGTNKKESTDSKKPKLNRANSRGNTSKLLRTQKVEEKLNYHRSAETGTKQGPSSPDKSRYTERSRSPSTSTSRSFKGSQPDSKSRSRSRSPSRCGSKPATRRSHILDELYQLIVPPKPAG